MRVISVFEHEKRALSSLGLTKQQTQALAHFGEQYPYINVLYNALQFKQYVGIIQLNDLCIEILPKADRAADVPRWQRLLVDLLGYCQVLPVALPQSAHQQIKPSQILEIYVQLFVQEVDMLLKHGLHKAYHTATDNRPHWRGNLHFPLHLARNLTHATRFYTQHTTHDEQHLIHQLIYKTLHTLAKSQWQSDTQQRISELLRVFPVQTLLHQCDAQMFRKITLNKATRAYAMALQLAELILLQANPTLTAGDVLVWSILLDMNQLFEKYVYKQLENLTLQIPKSRLHYQASMPFWERQRVRPDFVWEWAGKQWVFDAKWKMLTTATPADSDLKQLFVYKMLLDTPQSALIYPQNVAALAPTTGFYRKEIVVDDALVRLRCTLLFVEIADNEGNLNLDWYKSLWEWLEREANA